MEIFRTYCENVEVSNLGNVKINGVIVKQFKEGFYYCVYINNRNVRVHTMVGKCFPEICGEYKKYYHFHHKNRNQLDNNAENIVCLSPSEHKKIHLLEDGISIGVKAFTKDGEKIGEWNSMLEASEETGASYRHINNIVNGRERRFTEKKLFWFKNNLSDEEIKRKIIEIKNTMYQRVRK